MESLERRDNPSNVWATPISPAVEGSGMGFGTDGVIRVHRDGSTSLAQIVSLTYGGTATNGTDYSANTGATIPSGLDYVDVPIHPFHNYSVTGTLDVSLTIVADFFNSYTVGSPATATIDLHDSDNPQVSVAKFGSDPTEGGSGTFRISRTGSTAASLAVAFGTGGTATSGTDYTSIGTSATIGAGNSYVDVTVSTLPDNVVEFGGESASILISDGGSAYSAYGSSAFAAVAILDDAPVVSVSAGSQAFENGNAGSLVFIRAGGDLTSSLSVSYSIGGTGTAGTDYSTLSGTVTFTANSETAIVTVTALDNGTYSSSLDVTATVTSTGTYLAGSASTGTVPIVDGATAGFTLGSHVGTIDYTTPWASVDETLATQSLSLSDFSLTLAGHTFTASNFASTPTMQFAYGEYVGLTFSLNTSGVSGYPFLSLAMSASDTITGVDATTLVNVNAALVAKPDAVVMNAVAGPQVGSSNCTVMWKNCDGASSVTIIIFDANGNPIGSAINPTTKKSDTQTYTVTTSQANANVTVKAYIKNAAGMTIYTTDAKAGVTK